MNKKFCIPVSWTVARERIPDIAVKTLYKDGDLMFGGEYYSIINADSDDDFYIAYDYEYGRTAWIVLSDEWRPSGECFRPYEYVTAVRRDIIDLVLVDAKSILIEAPFSHVVDKNRTIKTMDGKVEAYLLSLR